MAMTLTNMEDYVYDVVDTDSTDLPTALVDQFIIDGCNRIEQFSDSWKFREVDYSISTVAGTQSYTISGSGTLTSGITYPIARVVDVRGPTFSMKPVSHRADRSAYMASTTVSSQYPMEYSLWGDKIYFWPKPSTVISVSITGYRDPIDWVTTAPTAPDYPDDFHLLIAQWAVSRAHAREGDAGLAMFYRDEFYTSLHNMAPSYQSGVDAQPFVLNQSGDTDTWRTSKALGPLIYPWE